MNEAVQLSSACNGRKEWDSSENNGVQTLQPSFLQRVTLTTNGASRFLPCIRTNGGEGLLKNQRTVICVDISTITVLSIEPF